MAYLIDLLTDLPTSGIFILIEVILVGLVVGLPRLFRGMVSGLGIEAQSSNITDAYKIVISSTSIVLAFLLVQVHTNFRNTEELTVREASVVNNADRSLFRYDDPRMAAIRPALLAYAREIVSNEWPAMANLGRSVAADHLYTDVSRAARAINPESSRETTIFTELLRALDEVSDLREARLNASGLALPALFWNALSVLFLLLFVLATLVAPTLERAVTLGGMIAAVGMLFALVVVIDEPFRGDNSVLPTAMQRTIAVMVARH